MSDTVFNQDGSVYMSFAPAEPAPGDLEGWLVREVASVHRTPEGVHMVNGAWRPAGWKPGTVSIAWSDVESFNNLLKLVSEMSTAYGYRPRSARIAGDTYRWTWERWTPDGTHMSDMIIASKIH